MTTFQKLLIGGVFSLIGFSGLYLYRQQELKKIELQFQQTQKQISDCKYLIANEKLIFEDQEQKLKLLLPSTKNSSDKIEQKIERIRDEEWDKYSKARDEYDQSAENCLKILRNLGE